MAGLTRQALKIATVADHIYINRNGHIVEALIAQAVRERPDLLHRHLGV